MAVTTLARAMAKRVEKEGKSCINETPDLWEYRPFYMQSCERVFDTPKKAKMALIHGVQTPILGLKS